MKSPRSVTIAPTTMVLSGGVGLGAYQAGAYEALHERGPSRRPNWLSASSVGAVNAALIAGNPPDRVVEQLRQFWADNQSSRSAPRPAFLSSGTLRHVQNWMSAIEARLFGVPGHFRPRLMMHPFEQFSSLYDLAPMRSRIEELVDFERLNTGGIRVSVATTDVETGDIVLFDTARGDRIGIEHLMATCGFLPEFAPVEIGGRLLGDGGLSANAPIEPVFDEAETGDQVVFIVDLYARDGSRPKDLETALARKNDLVFANQTFLRLRLYQREYGLRRQLAQQSRQDRTKPHGRTVFYLSYRAPPEEAGPEKPFDLSQDSVLQRWRSGQLDMEDALKRLGGGNLESGGITVIRRREPQGAAG